MRASAQFFPEGYEKTIPDFCVDCGNPKAMPPDDMLQQLMIRFEPKAFNKTRGKIYIQVLVDSNGTATLLSTDNRTNVKSKNLICNTPSTVLNGHLPTTKKYNLYN